jgi:hypothetical protein
VILNPIRIYLNEPREKSMKRLKLIVTAFLLSLPGALCAQTVTINMTFTYDFTNAVACPPAPAVTPNCLVNFQLGTLSAAGVFTAIPGATSGLPDLPAGLMTTVPATFMFPSAGVFGASDGATFAVVVNAQDLDGDSITSSCQLASVTFQCVTAGPFGGKLDISCSSI